MSIKLTVNRYIKKMESKLIPKFKRNQYYKRIRYLILIPLALICTLIDVSITLINQIQLPKRKNQNLSVKFKNIISGFANLSFQNAHVEVVARKRAEICSQCPSAVKTGIYSIIVDNKTKQIQGMMCKDCGCNLSAKVRSVNDSCPQNKW